MRITLSCGTPISLTRPQIEALRWLAEHRNDHSPSGRVLVALFRQGLATPRRAPLSNAVVGAEVTPLGIDALNRVTWRQQARARRGQRDHAVPPT